MFQRIEKATLSAIIRGRNFLKFHIATGHIYALQKVIKFDKWHIYGSSNPEYVKVATTILNSLSFNGTVVEVGCGLGNILTSCKFEKRMGFDTDANVIRAAKLINLGKNIQFEVGSFEEALNCRNIDVLVTINWVHNIKPESLIEEYLRFPRILILTEGVENYTYFHNREIFESKFLIISETITESRHIFLLIKK